MKPGLNAEAEGALASALSRRWAHVQGVVDQRIAEIQARCGPADLVTTFIQRA